MNFVQAIEALKQGAKVKRHHWAGYWVKDGATIKMHCKDGNVLDIRDTKDVFYTLSGAGTDDWEVVEGTPDLSIKTFAFGEALRNLKQGKSVCRKGWNGKGMSLRAQFPDEHSKMTFPYLYMTIPDCAEGTRLLPWQPAQVDVFSEDWMIVE